MPEPKQKVITTKDAYNIIAKLKQSELEKSQCGKRLLKFYNDLARSPR